MSKTASQFNKTILDLITILRCKMQKTDEINKLDKLKSRIATVIVSGGEDYILKISNEYFIKFGADIIQRNEKVFLNYNLSGSGSEFSDLLNAIKNSYVNMSVGEKDIVYKKVKLLLELWANF